MNVRLTQRIERIEISPTLSVMQDAQRYKDRGVDVVDYGPGEPDFPTPEHIKQAAIRALTENRTKYTAVGGIMPLREAVCAWHAAQLGSHFEPGECVVSAGGKHAIFNAVNALVEDGDEVIVHLPYWVSYPDMVKYAGAQPIFAQTHAADGFCLRAAEIERLITPRTRMVIVNSPSNPTGAVIPPDEFAWILEVCARRGIWLLSDECYSHFVYGDARPFSVASLPGAKECCIVIGSLSKTFAMTGWRMGYSLTPKPLAEAMLKLQSQSTSNANSIAQYAALAAMRGSMDSVHTMLEEYARRRARILEGLRAIPGITCTAPEGTFYVFPDVTGGMRKGARVGGEASPDTAALGRQLLEREHVAVIAGESFGAPGFLRLSYATSMERIEEGLRRLAHFFSQSESVS
jgi:aspartate aminotransferase